MVVVGEEGVQFGQQASRRSLPHAAVFRATVNAGTQVRPTPLFSRINLKSLAMSSKATLPTRGHTVRATHAVQQYLRRSEVIWCLKPPRASLPLR
jgi:hypothetical protein